MTSEAERKSVRERVNKPPRLIKKAIKQEKDKHCEIDPPAYIHAGHLVPGVEDGVVPPHCPARRPVGIFASLVRCTKYPLPF